MKTCVLLLLWLVAGIASYAQPVPPVLNAASPDCRAPSLRRYSGQAPLRAWCCESPDEPGLLRILAPELAAQCPECTLIAVAQCTLTEDDPSSGLWASIAAQRSRLRYTLRNPDGTISTHITQMTLIPDACPPGRRWHLVLYPPGDPVPACGQPLP